jgi:hypothetical protein
MLRGAGGRIVEEDLDLALSNRGLLGRLFHRLFRLVERSWHMYPLGVLFGLGVECPVRGFPRLWFELPVCFPSAGDRSGRSARGLRWLQIGIGLPTSGQGEREVER